MTFPFTGSGRYHRFSTVRAADRSAIVRTFAIFISINFKIPTRVMLHLYRETFSRFALIDGRDVRAPGEEVFVAPPAGEF